MHPYASYDDPVRKSSYALEFSNNSIVSVDDSLASPVPTMETSSYKRSYDFTGDKSVVSVKVFQFNENLFNF